MSMIMNMKVPSGGLKTLYILAMMGTTIGPARMFHEIATTLAAYKDLKSSVFRPIQLSEQRFAGEAQIAPPNMQTVKQTESEF
jgi:hypothetical protein